MRRHDYDDLMASRTRPWSWRREVRAGLRRIGIAVAVMLAMILAFWLVFTVFDG